MKKRLQGVILAMAAGLGLFVVGIWHLSLGLGNAHETLYQGKPSSYWLAQLDSQNATASNQAIVVLNWQIIPRLTDEMVHDTNDSNFKMELIGCLNKLPGVTIYYSRAEDRRMRAAYELGEFGPAARTAIPGLIRAVKGNDLFSRNLAITALGNIHGEPEVVIPLLMSYLDDDNMNVVAAEALGKYGGRARAAVPRLIPLLKINDPEDLEVVQAALKNIDPEAAGKAGLR